MTSLIEDEGRQEEEEKYKRKTRNNQRLNSGSVATTTTTTSNTLARTRIENKPISTDETFKRDQDSNIISVGALGKGAQRKPGGEHEQTRTKRKKRSTKVGLNNILRQIRHLLTEGWTNLEIQEYLQLNERTFYWYMAKINEIDYALFLKQEKESLAAEIALFKDRLLQSYRWFRKMADNEKEIPSRRMEAQRNALEISFALVVLKHEGPMILQKRGWIKELYRNSSYTNLKKA
jgi:ribulose bisphosphate carboxylase small subunit